MLRKLFLPEEGEKWCKMDVSSQEPRIGLHFCVALEKVGAIGFEGSVAMQERYIQNPKLDYHQYVTDMVNKYLTTPIQRSDGKTINLGLWYGLGVVKLADKLNLTVDATRDLLEKYHTGVPFVKALTNTCMSRANDKGFVTTILGRRRHFVEWENADWKAEWEPPIRDYELAKAKWGNVKLAGTYKAANSVIQGSAAEQTKKAILDLADEGIYPLIQVYDELSISAPNLGSAHKVKEALEQAIKFEVPMLAEGFVADNWAGENKVSI
jgi:DNA polymerase-1